MNMRQFQIYTYPHRSNNWCFSFPGTLADRRAAKRLTFHKTAWLMFLVFLLLSWLMMVFEAMHGFFPPLSTRGLEIVLPQYSIGVDELIQLDSGSMTHLSNGQVFDPEIHSYTIAEVAPGGGIFVDGVPLDSSSLHPWKESPLLIQTETIFLRPLLGASYGDVVSAIDLLKVRSDVGHGRSSNIVTSRVEPIRARFIHPSKQKVEESPVQEHAPNTFVPADRDLRERGSRPPNSNRQARGQLGH